MSDDQHAGSTPEELDAAFRKLWAHHGADALAEAHRLFEALGEGRNADEVDAWVAKIILGLVGENPDLDSWLAAVEAGSFELRPELEHAYSKNLKSRARHLTRQRPMYIGDIEEARRAWAAEVGRMQGAIHLIAASILLKEMRKNVAAKAALGPAWPLMVAVNDFCLSDVKRALHQFGAEKRLHELLAFGTRWALKRYVTETHPDGAPKSSRAADWRRSLPLGVDVRAYFWRPRPTKSETAVQVHESAQDAYAAAKQAILTGARPSFLDFAALEKMLETQDEEANDAINDASFVSSATSSERLSPPIEWLTLYTLSSVECFSRAMRAVARRRHREQLALTGSSDAATEDYRIQVWLEHWIAEGGGIPEALPIRFLAHLEEEACLAFETDGEQWRGYITWSGYGLLPEGPSKLKPATLVDVQEMNPPEVVWVTPARKVDRILVNAQPDVEMDLGG